MIKTTIVKLNKKGEAECIADKCYSFTTYFWYKGKKLAKPIIRYITKECFLDSKPTEGINKIFTKRYPIIYENGSKKNDEKQTIKKPLSYM